MDPRLSNLADILVNYSLKVQPGQWVAIRGPSVAQPLMEECVRFTLRAGGLPSPLMGNDVFREILFRDGSDEQLQWVSPFLEMALLKTDAAILIQGTENTRALSGVDPARQALAAKARRDLYAGYQQRVADGEFTWVIVNYPCHAYAQEAEMSLTEYEDFVYRATFSDQPDPVTHWRKIHERQAELIAWLDGKEKLTVRGPHADLSLSIAGRAFINGDGTFNMPSGEIYTSPVEDSAEGWIRFTYPAIREQRSVEGVEFRFEGGRIVEASARKNESYLLSQLNTDEGARRLGEFAIGTNTGIQRFTGSILFDEKIGGTIHLAVGRGFPQIGGANISSIHWDFICDMKEDSEIRADGELFYQNGKFVI